MTDNAINSTIPITNRFDIFSNWCDEQHQDIITMDEDSYKSSAEEVPSANQINKKREKPPPPIIIYKIPANYKNKIAEIKSYCKGSFHVKYLGDKLKLSFSEKTDFNNIKNKLISSNLEFHTFSLPEERQITVVLKNMPLIDENDILEDIRGQGLNALNCHLMQKIVPPPMFPVYRISFHATTSMKDIKKINYILSSRVYWERFESIKPAVQCYRCQAYGHTSRNCNVQPACVKCAERHLTKDCPHKGSIENPKCINCKGEHTANYSKCPVLSKIVEKNTRPKRIIQSNIQPALNFQNNRDFPCLPTSKAAPAPWNTTTPNLNSNACNEDFSTLMKEIGILNQLCDIKKMIHAIRTLNLKLSTCRDGISKLQAFAECASLLDG